MSHNSINIAGAGLAGLSAAIGLARRGHRVEVFEKNADSGAARHSDWDAIENWTTETDMLTLLDDWGIAPTFEHRSKLDFEVYDNDGVRYPVTTPRPFFYLLKRGPDRGSVEQELKRQALDYGVAIHYGQPRERKDVDIWAAGSQHGGFFLGVGMTFRTSHPDVVLGLVSTQAAPKAYAYLVIVDGEGTLSVVLTRDFKQARAYLNRSIAIFRKAKQFSMDDVKMTSGFGGLSSAFWQPASRPIVVGEAAGFQDFLWGFGIRYALFSGHLAARALDEGLDYEARDSPAGALIDGQPHTVRLGRRPHLPRADSALLGLAQPAAAHAPLVPWAGVPAPDLADCPTALPHAHAAPRTR